MDPLLQGRGRVRIALDWDVENSSHCHIIIHYKQLELASYVRANDIGQYRKMECVGKFLLHVQMGRRVITVYTS